MAYAELHCHTNFSFLDGASHPEDLVERAASLGYRALAVTDHDGFYGAVRFSGAAHDIGLPAVYGTEVAMDAGHLVLLASSAASYAALSHFVTKGQFRGEKDAPVYAWEDLTEVAEAGVYALTGCHQGAVPRAAQAGDLTGTVREAGRLREIFGRRLHMEMWHHAMPEDDLRNDVLWDAAHSLNLPVVATNNVHYAHREDAVLADVLAAIDGRRTLEEGDGFRSATDERYLKDPAEMQARFARYPGAVERSVELAEMLSFDLRLVAPRLPDFPMPGHFRSEMEYLCHITFEGAMDVYPGVEGGIDPRAKQRLEHELDVIERLGFPGYFLVVWDIVNFARSQDIFCQIRGSGADSAVCRCIGLTRVDPIRLHLPFERFLSEERGRPPDIDLDLESERREEVIQYCYRRYGRERAAMVANVITYRARSVLRDVGKTFGLTQAQVDGLSKYVDTRNPANLRLEAPLPEGMTADFIYDVCRRLDGFPRHLGIHSGGMVIADRPLWQVVPLEWGRMEDRSILQWDKDDCGAIGIVKFDLLGLGMLNALHLTVDTVEETHGVRLDLATIPQEPAIYEMLTVSDTVGVFQVESRAQMATLPKMKPKTFYDLAVEVALIRPGPIQGQSVHPYLRRRNGEEPIRYPHPSTEPILAKTLGVPIFQEQLMELARVCAGFDGNQSDRLRSAMTHKRSSEAMGRLQEEVFAGMAGNGITGPAADEIWEKLQGFAQFGFPESHSVSFAYIVYMSAWLKYHWPTEFLAGLLNAYPMGFYNPNTLVQDAQRHGVIVLDPDVNFSFHDCIVEPYDADPDAVITYLGSSWRQGRGAENDPIRPSVAMRMGLRYVRNLGPAEIDRIEAARQVGGAFRGVRDFAQRTGLPVDALEGIAASGAMASLGVTRREGLWAAGALAEIGPNRLALSPGLDAPDLPEMSGVEQHQADLWSTGISSHHPVEFIRGWLDEQGCVRICDLLARKRNGWRARVGGIVTHRQRPHTARGVIFFNLEDETGILNVVVLPEVWQEHKQTARRQIGLVIDGVVEYRDGVTNLVARGFSPWPAAGLRSRDFR
jgi:error-prone DNA polymerase